MLCTSLVQIAADPDYDLPASLGSQPALRGSERPKPPSAEQLRAELEEQKETLMWRYGLVSHCAVFFWHIQPASCTSKEKGEGRSRRRRRCGGMAW